MIPLRDNIPARTTPVVNYTMIALCSVAFFLQLQEGAEDRLVERYGMIPRRVMQPDEPVRIVERQLHPSGRVVQSERVLEAPAFNPWWTLLTCIFLHGGWLHFLGNMWFLHIFGDNVEDRIGHVGFLIFYVVCGVAASLAHLLTDPGSPIPTIGASGAIAGVMGSYFLLYPRSQVLTLVPIFFFLHVMVVPAPVFLGIWFLLQFFQGTLSVTQGVESGGVAWWAHIGGFAMGFGITALLQAVGETRPPVTSRRSVATRGRR
jgi:membrane associated rhomboid family serine protease